MKIKIGLLFCFVFTFSAGSPALFAQDKQRDSAVSAELDAQDPGKTPAAVNVTAIEIKGNKSISSNTVISKMKTRVGTPYKDNIISDDLKRLYLLGFFSDIKIDTESYQNGLKVIVNVVERPIIEKITFSGLHKLTMREDKIKGQFKSRETQYLDYPSLNDDVATFKKIYEKIGYGKAEITYKVDVDAQTNKAKVNFNVVEGSRMKIRRINVTGNTEFKGGRILKLLKTKRAWFFNAGVLKEDVLKEDIERVKSFYRRAGYADVQADYDVRTDPKRPFIYIDLKVTEGRKYLVGNVFVKGFHDIQEKEILKKITVCTPGKVFSQDGMKEDEAAIHEVYFDRGYISAQVQNTTVLNPDTQRTDITYTITENEVAYVNQIKIRGNTRTKDVVVRRELRIHPGDRFDGEKLRRSKERLTNLGFFDENQGISYDVEDTAVPNRKDLIVDVKEAKTGQFSFGGGYSTVDKLIGFIELEQRNFDWRNWPYFTGAGQNLKIRAALGSVTEDFNLSFTDPWIFDYPVSFGFDIYKRTHDRDEDVGYGYDEDVTGADIRLGKEISEYWREDLTYRFDNVDISNVEDDATNDLKKEVGTNNISSLTYGLTFDSRDNVFDTHRGNVLSGSLELAGLGGDKNYWKLSGRASHYQPMPKKAVLEFRGRAGIGKPYGDSSDIPIYERFFVGGASSVRGYRERKLGPIDTNTSDPLGGEAMLVGNVEYVYPLIDFFKLAFFYDIGNAWEKSSDFAQGGLKSSFGFGVRIKTPIGPLMLDYGIPLNKEPGSDERGHGRIHFNISHGF